MTCASSLACKKLFIMPSQRSASSSGSPSLMTCAYLMLPQSASAIINSSNMSVSPSLSPTCTEMKACLASAIESDVTNSGTASPAKLVAVLRERGASAARSAFDPMRVRTDAPLTLLTHILTELGVASASP